MKKIILGLCSLLLFLFGFISLKESALKAGELAKDTSISETEISNQQSTTNETVDSHESGTISTIITTEETNSSAAASTSVQETSDETETSRSEMNPVESGTTSSSIEKESESSTTNSSITSDSTSSVNSQSSSSAKQSSDQTKPKDSSKKDNTQNFTPSSKESSVKKAETDQNSESPTGSSETVSRITEPRSFQNNQGNDSLFTEENSVSVERNFSLPDLSPEAFSETSTLNLPEKLKVSEVEPSDLKGFELPLLNRLKNKAVAVLLYEGIQKVGKNQGNDYDTVQLVKDLYQSLFGIEFSESPEKSDGTINLGSLLYERSKGETRLMGIYIGNDYYLAVTKVQDRSNDKTSRSEQNSETNNDDSDRIEPTGQQQVTVQALDSGKKILVQDLPKVTMTGYGEQILANYPASLNITENERTKQFIEKIGENARKLGQDYNVFASVMIAQALLESGSGTSQLSLPPNYNLFGVKGTYRGQSVSMATQEDRGNGELYTIHSAFRKYPNYTASLGDYVTLLREGIAGNNRYYEQSWRSNAKNYLRATGALTGTYATDTNYSKKLNSIIALYHLTRFDEPKIETTSGVFIKGKEEIPKAYRELMKYPDYNGTNYNSSGSYPVGQCTWYAYNRVRQLGKSVDDYMGNGGEWGIKGKALGYEVSQRPKAGWLISFRPGIAGSDPRYGHVAFVEAVRPEGILISEGNVYGGTIISYRVIDKSLATSNQVSYIKPK